MKGKLISLAILSGLVLLGCILVIAAIANAKTELVYDNFWGGYVREYNSFTSLSYGVVGVAIWAIAGIASFVMDIIVLASNKSYDNRGGIIASGILGLFGGLIGVNAIVAGINASKISSSTIPNRGFIDTNITNSNEAEIARLSKELEALKSQNTSVSQMKQQAKDERDSRNSGEK